ncbi:MAG: PQQ-binding-like beta-propeller repeat protein [Pirellulales bacterium]
MRLVAVCLACLVAVSAAARAAENWPQFRGPTGDGMSTVTGLPVTWSEQEHVVWKTPIHGKAWSSPVIWDNQIWMTSATENGKQRYAVCVDRDSGKVLHDLLLYAIPEPQFCHQFNSYASCTPVIEEGRVYVHFGSAGTACLDTSTGKVLWSREDLECDHFRGAASSPILFGNLLVVALDGYDYQYVVALDKETGKTVWRKDRNIQYDSNEGDIKKGYSTATIIEVDGKQQLVYPSAQDTIAYEPLTGDELWRVHHGGMNAAARPLFGHGRVYINTAAGGLKLFALKVGGTGDVTKDIEWKSSQGVSTRSSQLLIGDAIYMVSDAGIATCTDAHTGKAIWQKRLDGEFSASPICAEGRIYYCNQDGQTFVVAARPEYELLATNRLDDGCMASPAVYGKAIYLRTKTNLYRIEN